MRAIECGLWAKQLWLGVGESSLYLQISVCDYLICSLCIIGREDGGGSGTCCWGIFLGGWRGTVAKGILYASCLVEAVISSWASAQETAPRLLLSILAQKKEYGEKHQNWPTPESLASLGSESCILFPVLPRAICRTWGASCDLFGPLCLPLILLFGGVILHCPLHRVG